MLAITDGWLLFRPHDRLARQLNCHGVPTGPPVGVDPRTGRLTTQDAGRRLPAHDPDSCESDRMKLAQIDNDAAVPRLLDEANRANASFYPIDPRGLAVFDTPISMPTTGCPGAGPPTIVPPRSTRRCCDRGIDSLRTLAEATDGLAIVDSNDLAARLQAGGRRSELVLPARLLLDRQARRKVPPDHRAREAARACRCARAAGTSRRRRRR